MTELILSNTLVVYEYGAGYVIDGNDVRGIAAATTPNPKLHGKYQTIQIWV